MHALTKRCACCWLAVVLAAAVGTAWGQPQIGYVYPAGGQRGTTFRIVAGGQRLGGAHGVHVSGEGVRASVVEYVRSLDNQELGDVARFLPQLVRRRWSARVMDSFAKRDEERRLVPDHPWLRNLDEKSPQEVTRLWTRLFDPKKQPNAQIGEQAEIEVTIDPDAAPGDRELRLVTPAGLTNPVRFQVGALPEVSEEELLAAGGPAAVVVDLPAVLNGQIMPGEVDRFRVRARQGQQLVVRMQARQLIPYLADAVPGWFQGTVALYSPSGEEVAYSDDYRFDPDPALLYQVPDDGVYGLEVRDAIYRGRDDFVYRIAVGELPFVTQVFPLGGREGAPTVAAIAGWNLAADTLELDTQPGGGHIRRARIGGEQGLCSEVPYAVDTLPETAEMEPNNAVGEAQQVALPLIVNGRIGQPGDVDVLRFEGRADEEVVAEVYARRLDSPLDSALRLLDATGTVVAANDDTKDPEMGLVTHQADSYVSVRLPQDGEYRVCLSDAQQQGGEAYAYRLRIGPPQPDFAVRLVPSTVNVGPGGAATVTAHALRKDGFGGDIEVGLTNAPAGFALAGGRIPSDQESVEMRLTAPRGAPPQAIPVHLEARAQIGGAQVTRPVVPAEDMMQAFLYRHLVPQQELLVAIAGSREVPAVWRPLVPGIQPAGDTPVRIPLGGTAQVQLKAPPTLPDPRQSPLAALTFRLSASSPGVMLQAASVAATGVTLTLKADANIAQVGDSGNAIVEAFVEPEAPAREQRVSLGVLPAIPLEVVQP